jgi:hypothetical protein
VKFVAKADYTLGIKDAVKRPEVHPNGTTIYIDVEPKLKAIFVHRTLSHVEIEAAKAQILNNGGPYAFGSVPGRDEGNINVQDAMLEGYTSTAHTGYDVYQNLTVFDTADPGMCPPAERTLVEQFMLSHYDLGNLYVRVDDYNLVPPWPTYPVEGDVNVEGVVAYARAGGFAQATLDFEINSANRGELVEALELAVAEEAKERADKEALSAKV